MNHLLPLALALTAGAVSAQQTTPPRFRGAQVKYFVSCLSAEIGTVAIEEEIRPTDLSPRVGIGFAVDTAGRVSDLRFLDNTCTGRDSCELDPATDATRLSVGRAFHRLADEWSPALRDGRPIGYDLRLTLYLPLKRIEREQNPDPLLFQGEDPDKSFRRWVRERVRYHESQVERGREGVVTACFCIEPDGSVTIEEIVSPHRKLAREVERVIRKSKGKWTPRKEHGLPQRTEFKFSLNFYGP